MSTGFEWRILTSVLFAATFYPGMRFMHGIDGHIVIRAHVNSTSPSTPDVRRFQRGRKRGLLVRQITGYRESIFSASCR